jgi:GLPGLI family protein
MNIVEMNIGCNRLTVIILLSFVCQLAYSQSPPGLGIRGMDISNPIVLDQANSLIIYKMSFVNDTANLQNVIDGGEYALLIGNRYSKFFNRYYLDGAERQITGGAMPMLSGFGLAGTEIFKNLTEGLMTVTTLLAGSRNTFRYKENVPNMTWRVENETKNILGYVVRKTTTQFRGRDYVGWFAPNIPLSNGPWKFGGLPGLILEIYDTQRHFVFEGIKIEREIPKMSFKPGWEDMQESLFTEQQVRFPIVKYDVQYEDTIRESLNEIIRKMHLDFTQHLTSAGRTLIEGSHRLPPLPYNPIELE